MPLTSNSFSARYALLGKVNFPGAGARWSARETEGGRRVALAVIDAARVANVEAARGVSHRHLASLLEIARDLTPQDLPASVTLPSGAAVGVAELVPGKTLARHIAPQPMNPGKAVAWILRLIDALTALHEKGSVHGAVSPWSIVAEPEGRAIAPVLATLVAPAVGPYCPPEQLKGEAPAPSDDVWALHAVLYAAVTGKPPFEANQRDPLLKQMLAGRPKPLSEHGVMEPALGEIIGRGLIGEKRLRVVELAELSRALDAWERDPKAMPGRRPPAARPAARSVQDIVNQAAKAVRDESIVFDVTTLPADGAPPELKTAVAPSPERSLPPPLPQQSQTSGPPPLPTVSKSPPLSATPSIAAKAPPPLPSAQVSAIAAPKVPAPAAVPPPAQPSEKAESELSPLLGSPLGSSPLASAPLTSPLASLGELAQQLPQAPAVPVVVPVAAPAPRKERRLSFNPFERKRKVWPIVVAAAVASGLGVYAVVGGGATQAPAAAPVAAVLPEPAKPRAPEKPRVSAEQQRETCVRSYFPEREFTADANFAFVCEDSDFREISLRLFDTARKQPLTAKDAPAKGEPSGVGLGWYELPAAAIIRKGCCSAAAPVNLPDTVGWCEQLESAVRRIADDSEKAGDLSPGARAFDKAVTCLYVHRISRPYSYAAQPGEPQRSAFQKFLSLAAINEAKR